MIGMLRSDGRESSGVLNEPGKSVRQANRRERQVSVSHLILVDHISGEKFSEAGLRMTGAPVLIVRFCKQAVDIEALRCLESFAACSLRPPLLRGLSKVIRSLPHRGNSGKRRASHCRSRMPP